MTTERAFIVTGKRAVVLGGGRSGRAAAELLARRGANVTLADSATTGIADASQLAALGVSIEVGPHRSSLLESADVVVLSPGVPPDQDVIKAARRAGVPIIGEIELAFRWLAGRVIAITGTKGKSTTTTLIARMLESGGFKVTAGGNLGTALSSQVADSDRDSMHVVEVSSFQLETTDTFHPWIAVLVNLSPDHLDRHASFEAYAAAKARIFRNQTPSDWAIVNADDTASLALAAEARARRFDFALDSRIADGVTVEDGQIVRRANGVSTPLLPVAAVRLPGRHLLADVLAASAVAAVAGVAPAAIERAVQAFNGLEHALELVAAIEGVRFVNDSKATNVVSVRRALESFESGVVAIMGGRYKGGDFGELEPIVRERVRAIVTIGEASDRIRAALGPFTSVQPAGSMAEAVSRAFDLAKPRGVVVLAPGCSSFDMFSDYAARGRAFKNEVEGLRKRLGA